VVLGATWPPAGRSVLWLHGLASAFDEDDVAPEAVVLSDAFPGSDDAEPGGLVQGHAGGVLGEDAGLDGPDAGGLGGGDQGAEQQAPGALASGVAVYVDRVLDDSGVDRPVRHRRGGYPADDEAGVDGYMPVAGKPGGGEGPPVGRSVDAGVYKGLERYSIDSKSGDPLPRTITSAIAPFDGWEICSCRCFERFTIVGDNAFTISAAFDPVKF